MKRTHFKLKNLNYTHTLNEDTSHIKHETHTHENLELFYFISGNAVFYIEGNTYKLDSGDIVVIRENESHFLKILSNEPYERIVINFPRKFLINIDPEKKLMNVFKNRPLGVNNVIKASDLPIDLLQIFQQMEVEKSDYNKFVTASVSLSYILIMLNNHHQTCVKEDASLNAKDKFFQIKNYINENIVSDLSIDGISEKFYISPSYLNRCFKEKTGYSVWKYIIVKRLVIAQYCIQNGKTAAQAAEMVGFNDYTAFYKQYKMHFGYSPAKTPID